MKLLKACMATCPPDELQTVCKYKFRQEYTILLIKTVIIIGRKITQIWSVQVTITIKYVKERNPKQKDKG